MKKNVLWNTIGTVFYFFCQWILTVILIRTTDYEVAGYFNLAMTTSSSYSTIALFNMRSYQVSDVNGEFKDTTYVTSRLVTCLIAFVLCAIAAVMNNPSAFQVNCILAYMGIRLVEAWVDVLHGMNQKYERYDIIGKSYLIRGFLTIVTFMIGILVLKNLLIAIVLVFLSTGLVVLFYDMPWIRRISNLSFKPQIENVFLLLKRCFPTVIISYLLSQENLLPKQTLQNMYGAATQGIYSTMAAPALIIQVASAVVFSPFLPGFSRAYYEDKGEFKKMLHKLYMMLVGAFIAIMIAAMIFGKLGLMILYGRDILEHYHIFLPIIVVTMLTATAWIFIAIVTAMRKIRVLLIGMIVDFIICVPLIYPFIEKFEKNGVSFVQILALSLYVLYMIIVCEYGAKNGYNKK